MDVPSLPFLALAAASACLFNLSRSQSWRQGVLLVTNLGFLLSLAYHPAAGGAPGHGVFALGELLPYAGFLALGFGLIHALRRGVPAAAYGAGILALLLVFFWLKQYALLPQAIFITHPYTVVGLSYVFFRVMHLVIDARDPEAVRALTVIDYLNYTLNFTSLVSGPIQRLQDYEATARRQPLSLGPADMGLAAERIVTGLFKIMVIAVGLSVLQKQLLHQVLTDPALVIRVWRAALLTALYPVYLFFNFSGYTDVVIGVARFFRIRLPENFDRPFSACSFIEYWSRWHITLSNWLKTYVYNPLLTVLMRKVESRAFLPYAGALALFVTFFLIGLWHGRTWNFFFFGLLNGLGVAVNQVYRIVAVRRMGRKRFAAVSSGVIYSFVARGLTFTWVAFTLLWFWSDWPQLGQIASALGLGGILACGLIVLELSCFALAALQRIRAAALAPAIAGQPILLSRYTRTVWVSAMLTIIFAVQSVMNAAAPEVVYKSF